MPRHDQLRFSLGSNPAFCNCARPISPSGRVSILDPRLYGSPRAQQPNSHRGVADALLPGNFFNGVALQIVLEELTIGRPAPRQKPLQIDRIQINVRCCRNFHEWQLVVLASHHAAITIEGDRVHPSSDHAFVAELVYSFPSFGPGRLGSLPRAFASRAPRKQEPDGSIESMLVCFSIGFACHCFLVLLATVFALRCPHMFSTR